MTLVMDNTHQKGRNRLSSRLHKKLRPPVRIIGGDDCVFLTQRRLVHNADFRKAAALSHRMEASPLCAIRRDQRPDRRALIAKRSDRHWRASASFRLDDSARKRLDRCLLQVAQGEGRKAK